MALVELTSDTLVVHVTGMDKLWALKSRLEVPLQHVIGVEVRPAEVNNWWRGIRLPGTYLPGVVTAGTFYRSGEWVFWDVHNPDKTIAIHLDHEHYARLVIEVDEPDVTAAAISRAIRRAG